MEIDPRIDLLAMLAQRLERLSVDSVWARRASGLRGSLIKALSAAEAGARPDAQQIDLLIERSFDILSKAAHEIPDREMGIWQQIHSRRPGSLNRD